MNDPGLKAPLVFKTKVCWFEPTLAKKNSFFFTDPYCAGVFNKHCLWTLFFIDICHRCSPQASYKANGSDSRHKTILASTWDLGTYPVVEQRRL